MVIKGGTRGNGRQLANYLVTMAENEHIEILDIDGYEQKTAAFLKQTLVSMSLTSELTKSQKGLYHAQINPAYGDDKTMTREKWLQAADMLGAALRLENQRRVIVLHVKQNRIHAHVVWERYQHETGKMVSDSFSRLAQNRVRKEMEQAFEHRKTPEKNPHRPEMKQALTDLWNKSRTGKEFVRAAGKAGYTISQSFDRRPFTVIDEHGRSFDLVRQLAGVKTKDVRERFKGEKLPTEKTAIKATRNRNEYNRAQERMSDLKENRKADTAAKAEAKKENTAQGFADNKTDTTTDKQKTSGDKFRQFSASGDDMTSKPPDSKQKRASQFAESRNDATTPSQEELERIREETRQRIKQMQENKQKNKGRGL